MTCIVGGDLGISKEEKKRLDFRLCSVGILKVGKVSVLNKSSDWW